jgi:hypothetical protein
MYTGRVCYLLFCLTATINFHKVSVVLSIKSGGSSILGKPLIYKRGGKNFRDVLYMCSMNAMKTNTACKALYERLRTNGKTGKQALIAVCNKLLKQVFAVVKNNTLYQPNYCSAKP